MNEIYLVNFECKKCEWDWIGTFAYCPNCKSSEVGIIDYESMSDFAERMIALREMEYEAYFILEGYDWNE